MKVGIQGIRGSFNEVAAKQLAPTAELVYLVSSEAVLRALHNGTVDAGVCAIKNSTGGTVRETKLALEQFPAKEVARLDLKISQCLIAQTDLPLSAIAEVHSHPQALKQCEQFLKRCCPDAVLVEEADTAICAQRLAQGEYPEFAAMIGNRACADLYGLVLLQADAQDLDDNVTTFCLYVS